MITLARRTLLLFAAAAAIAPTRPTRAQTVDGALRQPLAALYAALEGTMRAGRSTPFSQRLDALAPAVDQAFDLETVLKVSVGLRWDTMDEADKARLLKAYRRFTVATYVANFDRYDGEHFQILPGVRDSGSDRIVATEIVSNGQPTRLDYVMRDDGGNWKAVDVLLEGSISRVAVQRSDFRHILANGDTDALIASLQRKIADLSDGALSS
ncbi:MAG TPA: ABC transporter substrate-binding protein [Rhodopila sp.]|jgi:phospholipid transport system substrate-binding protein|nr:ABC transporter substrate-binding protein [Rhodopila sp.]